MPKITSNENFRKSLIQLDYLSLQKSVTRTITATSYVASSSADGSNIIPNLSSSVSFYATSYVVVTGIEFINTPASINAKIAAFEVVPTKDPSVFIT